MIDFLEWQDNDRFLDCLDYDLLLEGSFEDSRVIKSLDKVLLLWGITDFVDLVLNFLGEIDGFTLNDNRVEDDGVDFFYIEDCLFVSGTAACAVAL